MFIGHYGIAFALRAIDRRSRLWEQFLAVQALDIVWAILVLVGVERFHNLPGEPWPRAQQLDYVPWSHSLVTVAVWCMVSFGAYRLWRGPGSSATAGLIALAVASHWLLDLAVHPGDLPLYDDTAKAGFGLWLYAGSAWIEAFLVTVGAIWYLRSSTSRSTRWTVVLLAGMLGANAGFFLLAPPVSPMGTALMALLSCLLLPVPAYLLERGNP